MNLAALLEFFDILGAAAFAVSGATVALQKRFDLFGVLFLSSITAIGGDMLRDILAGEIPFVLRKEIYATASVIGAVAYYLTHARFGEIASGYVCFFLTTGIRIFAVQLRLNMPRAPLREGK